MSAPAISIFHVSNAWCWDEVALKASELQLNRKEEEEKEMRCADLVFVVVVVATAMLLLERQIVRRQILNYRT